MRAGVSSGFPLSTTQLLISFTGSLWRQSAKAKAVAFGWKVSTNLSEPLPTDGWVPVPAPVWPP